MGMGGCQSKNLKSPACRPPPWQIFAKNLRSWGEKSKRLGPHTFLAYVYARNASKRLENDDSVRRGWSSKHCTKFSPTRTSDVTAPSAHATQSPDDSGRCEAAGHRCPCKVPARGRHWGKCAVRVIRVSRSGTFHFRSRFRATCPGAVIRYVTAVSPRELG